MLIAALSDVFWAQYHKIPSLSELKLQVNLPIALPITSCYSFNELRIYRTWTYENTAMLIRLARKKSTVNVNRMVSNQKKLFHIYYNHMVGIS